MDSIQSTVSGAALDERKAALFDLSFVAISLGLYATAVLQPFFGLIAGAVLLAGGLHDKTKQVGKICLILSGTMLALLLALLVLFGLGVLGLGGLVSAVVG